MLRDPIWKPDPPKGLISVEQAIGAITGGPRRQIAPGLWYGSLNENLLIAETIDEFYPNPFEDDNFTEYGVCDTPEQFLSTYPYIVTHPEIFCVIFTPMRRAEQSPEGGWRWNKWGPYIGTRKPVAEYLYDEPEIEEVFVFHVLRFPPKEEGEQK